ncbi:MAG: hypothetical protein OQL16_06680 [Gammaproteobacteria bacterium]|nr:hypothetical protein [Gammaproteobacteria bacterium]
MIDKKQFTNRVLGLAVLTAAIMLVNPAQVFAKQNIVAVEGASFTINASMSQNLMSFMGKKVHVTLDSGKVISGTVKDVGDHFLHLEKLDGREYYDALIRIEDIGAFDSRFRTPQR